jgi:hypothetical protein
MKLNLGWGSEIDADQNPKAAATSAQAMPGHVRTNHAA